MRVLLIGGTRNLGPDLVAALLTRGHHITVLHRGQTPFTFPPEVAVRHADRTDPTALRAALAPGNGNPETWDLAVDTTLYTGPEARSITDILHGRTARYIALSTGQVYLVRTGIARPFREGDYDGPLMPEPAANSPDLPDWRYGIGKRDAEDALFAAGRDHGFPAITLRLPMINSRRDHYGRLRNLIARILDGQPLLVPDGPRLALRHVSGDDVIQAILRSAGLEPVPGSAPEIASAETEVSARPKRDGLTVARSGEPALSEVEGTRSSESLSAAEKDMSSRPKRDSLTVARSGETRSSARTTPVAPNPPPAGTAWNISQPESIPLPDFLTLLARLLGRPLRTARVPRETLTAAGLLRAAAPFSDPWMSALDPTRSLTELGMQYTPLEVYLPDLVAHALAHPAPPPGYDQRPQELALLRA